MWLVQKLYKGIKVAIIIENAGSMMVHNKTYLLHLLGLKDEDAPTFDAGVCTYSRRNRILYNNMEGVHGLGFTS